MNLDTSTVLLLEDNEDDVFIFKRAYQHAQLRYPIQVARDGQEALDYLHGEGEFADRTKYPFPFMVLLDLKVPLKPGLDVLQAIRSHPKLMDLGVVVLSSSAEARDIRRAYELGAEAYLVKPPASKTIAAAVAAMRARASAPRSGERVKIEGDMFEIALPSAARSSDSSP